MTRQQCDAAHCPGYLYYISIKCAQNRFNQIDWVSLHKFLSILVDGKWTRFGPWSNCDVNCGEGNKKRISRCADPEPYKGGKECEGGTIDENKHQIKIEVESCIGTDKHGKERMCPSKFTQKNCKWVSK